RRATLRDGPIFAGRNGAPSSHSAKSTRNAGRSLHRSVPVHCPEAQVRRRVNMTDSTATPGCSGFRSWRAMLGSRPDFSVLCVMIRIISTRGIIVGLLMLLAPMALAQERRPRSVLVLDQSDLRGRFYYELSAGLRGLLGAPNDGRITVYGENLDLTRFGGVAYEQSLKRHFKEKYRDRPIGVIVAIGAGTLELTLRWREELWPGTPVVFAMLDE